MKLAFKIYQKVRELKREEREVKENIERYKKEEEIKLEKKIQDAWEEFHLEVKDYKQGLRDREDRLKCKLEEFEIRKGIILSEKKEIEKREDALDQRKQELHQREQKLNELQRKLNDQILKLGIVEGVNK